MQTLGAVIVTPGFSPGRPVLDPGFSFPNEFIAVVANSKPHIHRIVSADDFAALAEIGHQNLGVPAAAGQHIHYCHTLLNAEEFKRFLRVTIFVSSLRLAWLCRKYGAQALMVCCSGYIRQCKDRQRQCQQR